MPKINITTMYQGINASTPPTRRNSGYVEDAENVACEVLKGNSKRSPLVLEGSANVTTDPEALMITVKGIRIFISPTSIKAYDTYNAEIDINDNTGTDYEYIRQNREDLDYVVAQDTVFITNRNTTVEAEDGPDYELQLTVNTYSELPRSEQNDVDPVANAYYRVLVEENLDSAGYYQYVNGEYVQVAPPADLQVSYVLSTMPHRFVYDSTTNSLTYSTIPFDSRKSGNYKTNVMLLVDQKIKSINYYQSRLVLITNSNINLSYNSNIFRLFLNSMDNITTSDRSSKDILESNVGEVLRSVVVGNSIVITCENAILCFDAENGTVALTNVNGSVRKISDTQCVDIQPATNGIYTVVPDINNYMHMIRIIDPRYGPQEAFNLNGYEPELLRGKTIKSVFQNNTELYVLTDENELYIHSLEEVNGQYAKLAWTRFTTYSHTPLFLDRWDGKIRFVCETNNGKTAYDTFTYDTNIFVQVDPYTAIAYDGRLDARETAYGSYLPKEDETMFVHEIDDADIDHSYIINGVTGVWQKAKRVSGRKAYFDGKISDFCFLGFNYKYNVQLTNLWPGANNIRLLGSKVDIFVQDSTDLNVIIVDSTGREYKKSWTNFRVNYSKIDENTPVTTAFGVTSVGDMRHKVIKFVSESPGPITVNAISYTVQTRGK